MEKDSTTNENVIRIYYAETVCQLNKWIVSNVCHLVRIMRVLSFADLIVSYELISFAKISPLNLDSIFCERFDWARKQFD